MSDVPPTIAGVQDELESSTLSEAGLFTLACIFATCGKEYPPELGGPDAASRVASLIPGFSHPGMLPASVQDWAVDLIAESGVMARAGEIRPTVLNKWDKAVKEAEDRFHAAVEEQLLKALKTVARRTGIKVMSAAPAEVRASLRSIDLHDLPERSMKIQAGAVTLWVKANVDVEAEGRRQHQDLRARVRELVERFREELGAAALSLFGVALSSEQINVDAAVSATVQEFTESVSHLPTAGLPATAAGRATRILERARSPEIADRTLERLLRDVPTTGPRAARTVADILREGAGRMVTRRRFRYGKYGRAENPFQPHVDVNGVLQSELPQDLGWVIAPGDHAGCRCGWEVESSLLFV